MKDTKTTGAAKKTLAKTGAKAAAPKTAAKPAPKSQAAKTAAKDKTKASAPKAGKDVAKAAKPADKAAAPKAAVPELKKGDYFKFGSYYQENSSRKTPIEWLVLKKSGSKVLLISRYGLDCKQYYHEYYVDMTWENCDLRKWLNGDFLRNAFTAAEQKKIAVTKLANDNNAQCGTFGGNSTEDRVFLLSLAEAGSLFKDDVARKCALTAYAVGKGAYKSDSNFIDGRGCCDWWLRSPGNGQSWASYVYTDGALVPGGICAADLHNAVRPALWVNL